MVDKFLAGKTSPEEEQLLSNYMESFQQPGGWDESVLGSESVLEQRLLERLQDALPAPARKMPLLRISRRMAAAAVFFILAASLYLLRNQLGGLFKQQVAMQEMVTRVKERRQVKLEDGTEIWMEPGSRLVFPEHFSGDTREVNLTGGAFFEVAKNPEHPFIIHTGTLSTKVLGTSFNIKAYAPFKQEVAVVTGKVMVETEDKADTGQVILVPNQKVAWNARQHRLEKSLLPNAAYYVQRRFGKFIYEGETVASVLDDIQQQYNVQVQLNSPAAACTFYGDFDTRQEVEKVLNAVAATLNAQVKKEAGANTWSISGGGCASPKL